MLCVLCALNILGKSPTDPLGVKGLRGQEAISLEADSTLGKVFLRREANTGNPLLGVGIVALKEAENVLLFCKLCWCLPLEFLAKVVPAYLNIGSIEEEEDVLLLCLNCVELAGSFGIGFLREANTLGEVTH